MDYNITYEEYCKIKEKNTLLVDIRDANSVSYGMLPGATHILPENLESQLEELAKYDQVVLYCGKGVISLDYAKMLREHGIQADSLEGGYLGWLVWKMDQQIQENWQNEIEQGLRKRYHKKIFAKFAKGCKNYELIQENDKIAVCISGGKDSMLMAKLFQELQRHRKVKFDLVFLVMDPGYNKENRKLIEYNAAKLGIPITIFETQIFDIVYEETKSPCYLCARMRRGNLYAKAKELGCNKIALGHHYDDVIETILMGMLYGAQIQTMMPKLHSTNFPGMELIRPMYLIREEDIKRWRDENDLQFLQCACHFTETCSSCDEEGHSASKRMEIKHLIATLKKGNPYVESNIFNSMSNVNLDTVIEYKQNQIRHSFLDSYDKE